MTALPLRSLRSPVRYLAVMTAVMTAALLATSGEPHISRLAMASAATPSDSLSGVLPLATRLVRLGLENVSVDLGHGEPHVAYENRRYRHSADALGHVAATVGGRVVVLERRLGLIGASFDDPGDGVPTSFLFPSDEGFPLAPAEKPQATTHRSVDLELRPLVTYELGRIFDPVLVRLELQPELHFNPWPGGRLNASLVIPLRNDFQVDALHPDVNRVRPGPSTLEQFAWAPNLALLSGSAGLFAGNRYGASIGIARPLRGGEFLLDAQADLTGFIAFPEDEIEYSRPTQWSGFAGATWRPPILDLAIRVRAARFLLGDRGGEVEIRRSLGDLDVAFFFQRADDFNLGGLRLEIPIPPLERSVGSPVRVQPVARFPIEYRDEVQPLGLFVKGVASREDHLRHLSRSAVTSNLDRYRKARGMPTRAGAEPRREHEWVSLTGMTGFVNTPWCGVLSDRAIEVGYNTLPKAQAYDHRGEHRNDVYYAALGFLPHLEVGLRWTVIPGLIAFQDIDPESRLQESDRMLSARLELLPPQPGRPGLALGIEDAVGTRRFHSTYVVTGVPISFQRLQTRFSLGYAPTAVTATRHTLDGVFGAFECSAWRPVAAAIEHDSEKWNAALGWSLGYGFRARVALLNLESLSVGAGWSHAL